MYKVDVQRSSAESLYQSSPIQSPVAHPTPTPHPDGLTPRGHTRRTNLNRLSPNYSWPNGPGPMGQHGHDPKKHGPSTARARHYSASAGTRHGLYSAWAAGPARGTSTGTARLMGWHDTGPIIPKDMAF